ncbi:MAG: hypothetical protein AAGE84_06820 [Cyanobacteria bacterium P01_G01_bin.39]
MKPINFQKYNDSDLIQEYNDINCRRVRKLTLERVEKICEYYGNPSSEKDVSGSFDEYVRELQLDITDKPLLREAFANYVDMIEQDGLIHRVQSYQYDYVGKLNMDD